MKDIHKILFITLSNIGDCILTLPALDILRQSYPQAKITVMVGVRPKELFEGNPAIDRVIVFDKHAKLREKIRLFKELKKEKFDLVIDLRNSLFGVFLQARYTTLPLKTMPVNLKHMKDIHLNKITNYKLQITNASTKNQIIYIGPDDKEYVGNILRENNIKEEDKIIVIAPGARSHIKRWQKEKFVELISLLIAEFKAKVILVGDKEDSLISGYILKNLKVPVLDLAGKTNIRQLACLLKKSALLITNDSAVLHLGSYLNVPIVSIFGPTNEEKYGPWSAVNSLAKKEIFCRPCEKALCRFGALECMQLIKTEDVMKAVRNILSRIHYLRPTTYKYDFQRMLIVRTDRIGDVLLSTPVIKALRDNYPNAFIAMMVSPYAKDVIEGNPYLDQVIVYDKDSKHKSWLRSMQFAQNLKKNKFDLVVILHPTNRMHLVTFLAGIPRRIGFNRKMGFSLTDKLKHTKQQGEKHELEYNLDLLKALDIEPLDKNLYMPIKKESEHWVKELLEKEGVGQGDKLLAIHSAASCPSKIWPNERFAQVADRLAEKYGFRVLIIAGPKDTNLAQNVIRNMQHAAINLSGRTSVSQLASVLKRCQLFISNDSGPVHIASAVGTPVISIFGRNQAGLSPKRWGPVGKKDRFLHKPVGCITCLAHNCVKQFACLKAISVDDVVKVADEILSS